ncbi:MAG: VWA domain-containing protein [Acidimicrobiales bacterium]
MSWFGEIEFDSASRLWLLTVVGVLLIAYVVVQRRRGTYALRFSDTSLLDNIAPKRPGWRRHVVAVLFLASASMMVVSFAGPYRFEVPFRATVVLTIDTSLSMGATDVAPTRFDAAKQAAKDFLTDVPDSVDVALISFDEFPVVQVAPTDNRAAVAAAVDALELGPFTGTGDAIVASVGTIVDTGRAVRDENGDPTAVVVLLSDGEPTIGRSIDEAIAAAVDADIEISTVALGTPFGEVEIEDPEVPGTFFSQPVPVDEVTMETVALGTGGEFFTTDSFTDLAEVYRDIGTALGEEPVRKDEDDWFVGFALAGVAVTALLSLTWFQRLP